MPSSSVKRPVRIGGASGGFTDRQRAMHDLAKNCQVDVIMGGQYWDQDRRGLKSLTLNKKDWMSECTMTIHGATKTAREERLAKDPGAPDEPGIYDACFMSSVTPALPILEQNSVKLAVNAGASDPMLLAKEVKSKVEELGLNLKVAWIEGDEVTSQMKDLRKKGEKFASIDTGKDLDEWGHDAVCAQCYLGGMGIAAAFKAGADIVIAGR